MNEMKCLYFITHSLLKHIIINKGTLEKMQKSNTYIIKRKSININK